MATLATDNQTNYKRSSSTPRGKSTILINKNVSPAIIKLKEEVEDKNVNTISDDILIELLQSVADDRKVLKQLELEIESSSPNTNPVLSTSNNNKKKSFEKKDNNNNRVSKSSTEAKRRQREFQRRLTGNNRRSNSSKKKNSPTAPPPGSINNIEENTTSSSSSSSSDVITIDAVISKPNPRLLRTNSVDNDNNTNNRANTTTSRVTAIEPTQESNNSAPPDPVARLSNSMGFPRPCVEIALKRCDGDLERAVNDLLTNMSTLEKLARQNSWRDELNSGDSIDVQADGRWVDGVVLEKNSHRSLILVQFLNREQWFRLDTKRLAHYNTKSRTTSGEYTRSSSTSSTSSSSTPRSSSSSNTHVGNTLNVDDESNYWIEYIDEETQAPYYYNTRTHISSWEKPDCLAGSDMPT